MGKKRLIIKLCFIFARMTGNKCLSAVRIKWMSWYLSIPRQQISTVTEYNLGRKTPCNLNFMCMFLLIFFLFILFSLNLFVPSFYDTGIPVSGINTFIPAILNNRAPIHMKHQETTFLTTLICCGTLQQLECCKHPEIKVARRESLSPVG